MTTLETIGSGKKVKLAVASEVVSLTAQCP
jgi:hypothetical protein